MDMAMKVLPAERNASPDAVERVRGQCIQHGRKTCGYILFRDAAEYQYRTPDEDEREFPSMKVGGRIVIPKDRFLLWIENSAGRADTLPVRHGNV